MIACSPAAYEKTCVSRGYTLEHCRKAVVGVSGSNIVIDEQSAFYPRKNAASAPILPNSPGPGTELKTLLKTIGIVAKPNCSCNKRAQVMNERGCDWCEKNIDEIDGWLAEEASKRKLPYISLAGKTLIKLAIRRARKKGNG